MSHFGKNELGVKKTPSEWLKVGKSVGELANKWSGRTDLIAYVGGEMKAPAPALFDPASAEIEVNNEVCFGSLPPTLIPDLSDPENHYDFPKGVGAIFHEALHAKYSRWSMELASKELNGKQYKALNFLEEIRIEAFGSREMPTNKYFLSACALEIVLGDDKAEDKLGSIALSGTRYVAKMATLILGRVDVGILELSDVPELAKLIEGKLGTDLVENLRELWIKASLHSDHDNAEKLYPLAIEWDRLVSEKEKENGEGGTCGYPSGEGDDEGEGENEGEGEDKDKGEGKSSSREKTIEEILAEIEKAKENTELTAIEKLSKQQIDKFWKDTGKARADKSAEKAEHKKSSQRVFGEPETDKGSGSNSKLVEVRKPTASERASAVLISKLWAKAKYRNRTETRITSVMPKGRLRSRAVVQREALKSKGVFTPVETWKYKTRKHTETPNLSIGIMVDVSGSMGSAMKPMATTAWVLSEAGRRIQAKTAMVNFGSGVFPTLKVGQRLDEVNVYSANDGTEKFDLAFQALNGQLELLDGKSARLLVVVSDACYTAEEINATKHWLSRCMKSGVGVLWITYEGGHYVKAVSAGTDTKIVKVGNSITEVAEIIGKLGAEALTSANAKQGR
jgi:hypothetical protein